MRRLFVLLTAFLLVFASPAALLWATDYFVENLQTASNGDGSAEDPFGTITEAVTSGVLQPGDRLFVAAGLYDDVNGNEVFPIPLPNGVEICGQSASDTLLLTNGPPAFTVVSCTQPAAIKGFQMVASAPAIVCSGLPADLAVRENMIPFPGDALLVCSASSESGQLCISSNWMGAGNPGAFVQLLNPGAVSLKLNRNQGQSVDDFLALAVSSTASNADIEVCVSGNDLAYIGDGIVISAILPRGDFALKLCDNRVDYASDFLELLVLGQTSGDVDVQLKGNHFNFVGDLATMQFLFTSGTSREFDLEVRSNVFKNCEAPLFGIATFAVQSNFQQRFDVACNDILDCNLPLFFLWNVFSADVVVSGSIHANRSLGVISAGGFYLQATVGGSGSLALDLPVRENVFMNAADLGPQFLLFATASATLAPPDFGGGPLLGAGEAGCNTLRGNGWDQPLSSRYDLLVIGSNVTTDVFAQGNFWWSTSLSEIEERVIHDGPGDGGNLHVDFANPLPRDLSFAVVGTPTPGSLVRAFAAGGSKFVAKAGSLPICVQLDGVDVEDVDVAADGSSLSFFAPAGLLGNVVLLIKNPGGQTGTTLLLVTSPGGGGCFVATAAYGDLEAPEVQVLRRWRDECLADNALGRQLVQAYYAVSPALAEAIETRPVARSLSRAALTPVVGAVQLWLDAPWLYGLGALFAAALWLRRRGGSSC